jgi:RNase P subunit RPR2
MLLGHLVLIHITKIMVRLFKIEEGDLNGEKRLRKPEDLDRLCWHCNTKLLYGGEHDISQEDEFYDSVTYMGCPECGTHVEIYKAKKNIDSYEAKSNAIH